MIGKKGRIGCRILAACLSLAILASAPGHLHAQESEAPEAGSPNLDDWSERSYVAEKRYYDYLGEREEVGGGKKTIEIDVQSYTDASLTTVVQGEYGYEGASVITQEDGHVTYEAVAEKGGYYALLVEYYPMDLKGIDIEKEIQINGERPYFESRNLKLSRVFCDSSSVRENLDANGNEMRPAQTELFDWYQDWMRDGSGYYSEPMLFYLEEGKNEVKLTSVRETAAIRRLAFASPDKPAPYEPAQSEYGRTGSELIQVLQAEESDRRSSPMLIPSFDRSSPKTSPQSTKKIKLNIVSGERYKIPGQWLEYDFEVPEDGLYQILFRSRQNGKSGSYSTRSIQIDGKVPFEEAKNLRFDYSTDWKLITPTSEGEACLFPLEKGEHTLRVTAELGTMTEYLDAVEASLARLNAAYREVLMLTGPTPDRYRDYYFMTEIPEVFETLEQEKQALGAVKDGLYQELGYAGESMAVFGKFDFFFDVVLKDPAQMAKQLNNFKNYIGALATWMLESREQPVDLDVICIAQSDYEPAKAEAGLFQKLAHECAMFVGSFFSDFNSIKGESDESRRTITVWTQAPRDHVNILRQMIDEEFTPESGIDVSLQLVSVGSLLPSALAGIGPDVALSVPSADVLNYAARDAILDLSGFSGIDEVKERFMESALVPMEYDGGFYGIPETQTFPVLFYRKDILAELSLQVPRTWQDVYLMLSELQKKNMTFGLKTGMDSYSIFLSQMGGSFYQDDNRYSALARDLNVNALRMQTDMFLSYDLPQKYDFANRFRTGEMPVGIDDYTTYNLLTVFAPEIKGLWGFAPLPGILQEDGSIDHSAASAVTASILLSGTKEAELAYEFISWFDSAPVQLKFGRELESILGTAARYNSANVEAVKGSSWQKSEVETLLAQWEAVKGIPEVPGGYYTKRYVDFAFRAVVLQNQLPREVMMEFEDTVNEEIKYKRLEFGLDANEP